jgi:hypothetical protein
MNSDGFMSTENVLKEGAEDTLTSNWWIHYQVFAYNNYLFGCTAADKSPAFDMRNLLIQSASPVGGFDEVDYCISESRRGSFNTLSFAAYPMLLSKSASMMNALSASIKLFSAEYGPTGITEALFWIRRLSGRCQYHDRCSICCNNVF